MLETMGDSQRCRYQRFKMEAWNLQPVSVREFPHKGAEATEAPWMRSKVERLAGKGCHQEDFWPVHRP